MSGQLGVMMKPFLLPLTLAGWRSTFLITGFKVFIPMTKPKDPKAHRLFIFDGHNSHISFEMAQAAVENNIHLLCLPPHTTHALQPLDVACFRSAKAIWSRVCNTFFDKHSKRALGKEDFPACIKIVSDHLQEHPEFCINGFRRCGIYPYDRTAGDDKVMTIGSLSFKS